MPPFKKCNHEPKNTVANNPTVKAKTRLAKKVNTKTISKKVKLPNDDKDEKDSILQLCEAKYMMEHDDSDLMNVTSDDEESTEAAPSTCTCKPDPNNKKLPRKKLGYPKGIGTQEEEAEEEELILGEDELEAEYEGLEEEEEETD